MSIKSQVVNSFNSIDKYSNKVKIRLNIKRLQENIHPIHNNTIYSFSIILGILSLTITLWKPISSYFSGVIVGSLLAINVIYLYFNWSDDERKVEKWFDFPLLDSILAKIEKEDRNTNIQVNGAFMSFHSYDVNRNDDFVRFPCDLRLDGYRLIIQLANKNWNEEKKLDKDVKFIGYREYLIKEARIILVPELTLTRSKYWMNEYPIVIKDLQILDKQIYNKQQYEKSKSHTNDFFINNATSLSIWFETCPQKEEWFHKLSLVLRRGKNDIERTTKPMLTSQRNSFNQHEDLNRGCAEENIEPTHLHISEYLDQTAITINILTRRLLYDLFSTSVLNKFLKNEIEKKLNEISTTIFDSFRVISIDTDQHLPVILKIEPMQSNTKGIWFNLLLYYRGTFKTSIRTRISLEKIIKIDQLQIGKVGKILKPLMSNKYFQMLITSSWMKAISQREIGIDIEIKNFYGNLTLNIPPPPSDRLWLGFPQMPDFDVKIIPTFGTNRHSYRLIQDFLEAKVRKRLRHLIVMPAMDDQLLPFFRDWAIDIISICVNKPIDPLANNYKNKSQIQTSIREQLKEYKRC